MPDPPLSWPKGLPRACLKTTKRLVSRLCAADLEGGCWRYMGCHRADGRPNMRLGDRSVRAYRVAWTVFVGALPEGMDVHHECGNNWCCNPEHLTLLSRSENTRLENQQHPRGNCGLCGSFVGLNKRTCDGCNLELCNKCWKHHVICSLETKVEGEVPF